MGFIGNLFGANSGDSGGAGMNYNATKANLISPDLSQLPTYNTQAQEGLQSQRNFYNDLKNQNGIGNQSNVYNQLQGIANGTGPNPAQAMLSQQTGQNVANQAALMAGQRGSGSNAGLIARQAAMQGSNAQQQAIGQGAALQANQSLNALGSMGNLATAQVGQQQNALSGFNQMNAQQQAMLLAAMSQYNNANVASQSNVNNANAGIANTVAQGQQGLFGGALNAIGGGLGSLAHGGMVQRMADGGMPTAPSYHLDTSFGAPISSSPYQLEGSFNQPLSDAVGGGGAGSWAANFLKGASSGSDSSSAFSGMGGGSSNPGADAINKGVGSFGMGAVKGAMKIAPTMMAFLQKGGDPAGVVPGKAEVRGDSLRNDKIPAMLSAKEIVIPRSITLSKNAPDKAKDFVASVLARNGMKRG